MEEKLYKTEPHLHTSETSPCSHINGREIAERYSELGYTTVFITDHYRWDLFEDMEISRAAEKQLAGYRSVKKAAAPLGLTVLLGCEICFDGKDYLLYGIDEKFFEDPAVATLRSPVALKEYCSGKNITVIGAHPYREWREPVIEALDGIEIINTAILEYPHNHNEKARALSKRMPQLLTASGSDAHEIEDMGRGGIITTEPITSPEDYIRILKSGNYSLIHVPFPEKIQ